MPFQNRDPAFANESTDGVRVSRTLLVGGALFLSSGAALLVYIVTALSLLWTALGLAAVGVAVLYLTWHRSSGQSRLDFRRRVVAGLIAGAIATTTYDLSRFALIKITGIAFWPFDIFRVFGLALMGDSFGDGLTRAAGFLYHVTNGIGFGIAYTLWMGNRGIWSGIMFAMLLELCMVSVYPGWLGMKAINEFLQVSVFGHIVYGVTLGHCARTLLLRCGGEMR